MSSTAIPQEFDTFYFSETTDVWCRARTIRASGFGTEIQARLGNKNLLNAFEIIQILSSKKNITLFYLT